jgi:hypothetical protein
MTNAAKRSPAIRSTSKPLGVRALNRALLARQSLLRRASTTPERVIDNLVGLQTQAPNAPYFGLWSRIERFTHQHLAQLLRDRQVVRIALMRSTLHLVTASSCLSLRPLVQPALSRALAASFGRMLRGVDLDEVACAGRELVEEHPRTLAEIGTRLAVRWRDRNAAALAQTVRALVPLVQLPPRGVWGHGGAARHTSAEHWLESSLGAPDSAESLVMRYLAAFGPASTRDAQKWSGLTRLGPVFERLRSRLRVFPDENGVDVFDLPEAPRPEPDAHAPPRFLPEFDNVLLSYVNNSRILDQADRSAVFTSNGVIRATFLVDGFVRGTWQIVRDRAAATLVIEPFRTLTKADASSVADEGERLLRFATTDTGTRDVVFRRR